MSGVVFETVCMQIKARWLYCVECPQYSIRLEALGYFAYRQKKSTGMVADTVANVTAALFMTDNAAIRAVARAGEGKIGHPIK